MKEYNVTTDELKALCPSLRAGDKVILSGTVYTARDAAHKRIFECLENGSPLPLDIKDSVIYYAGPTPTPEGLAIGDDAKKVTDLYGNATESSDTLMVYEKDDMKLRVIIKDDSVQAIEYVSKVLD